MNPETRLTPSQCQGRQCLQIGGGVDKVFGQAPKSFMCIEN